MIYTTLNKILAHGPCGRDSGSTDGWAKLLCYLHKTLPDDEPLSILTILESNGLDDALWALRAVDGYDREIRELACDFAEHAFLSNATKRKKATPRAVSWDAARAAAWAAAWNAAWNAARPVRVSARVAAWEAAFDAEREWQRTHFVEWLHNIGDRHAD